MKLSKTICLLATSLLLSGCGKDYNGWGESEGFGGYTKGWGDVEGYGYQEVGLCSYIGGCMPESKSTTEHSTVDHTSVHDTLVDSTQ